MLKGFAGELHVCIEKVTQRRVAVPDSQATVSLRYGDIAASYLMRVKTTICAGSIVPVEVTVTWSDPAAIEPRSFS